MSKSPQEVGKEFEVDFRAALEHCVQFHHTVYCRLYDTASAAGYLPKQAGDFVAVCKSKGNLLECKSSMKHQSLSDNREVLTSNMSQVQMASCRLWERAGANSWIFFLDYEGGEIEVWKGSDVAEAFFTPRTRLKVEQRIDRFHKSDLKDKLHKFLSR